MKYIDPADQRKRKTDPPHRDHKAHRQPHVQPVTEPLYVVTVVNNPMRYWSRYKLYEAFAEHVADAGGILYTVELAQRDRHFEVTDHRNPRHIQLRSPSVLWHKEALTQLGISRLPADWKYVAWLDADTQYARPDFVNEILHQLQVYKVVQTWTHAIDLTSNFQPHQTHQSYMSQYLRGVPHPQHGGNHHGPHEQYYHGGSGSHHPGYGWAARRSAIADLGGLGDIGVLGAGDHHMCAALVGKVDHTIHRQMHKTYKDYWLEWQARAERYVQRNVGVVDGTIFHYHHGPKAKRLYNDRWKILVDEQFNWHKDLKRDPQGLWTLTERNFRLRDKLVQYFGQRDEDDPNT
jgi:hypothetical protein